MPVAVNEYFSPETSPNGSKSQELSSSHLRDVVEYEQSSPTATVMRHALMAIEPSPRSEARSDTGSSGWPMHKAGEVNSG